MTLAEWNLLAQKRLKKLLKAVAAEPALRRRIGVSAVGRGPRARLVADLEVVGAARMTRINGETRRKRKPTDVLSFPAPGFFQRLGHLGELIVCAPVCARQAREQGHPVRDELDVLLAHGVLHLLGFDHERGPRAALEMARWERKLLSGGQAGARSRDARGLIGR